MRNNDARKLSHDTLEEMRRRAVMSVQEGQSPEIVGQALGLNRTTIYDWLALYRRGGWDGEKPHRPAFGRHRHIRQVRRESHERNRDIKWRW
jgi:transposase